MKKPLLVLLCLPMIGFGQGWSNYYIDANVNHNINANVKIDVSGTIKKNITTIDYGQLARANAEREKNRLSKAMFEDNRDSRISLEVASDPSKAFEYGEVQSDYKCNRKCIKENFPEMKGIRSVILQQVIPHKSLVSYVSNGNYQNISTEGIITEYEGIGAKYNKDNKKIVNYNKYKEWYDNVDGHNGQEFFIKPLLNAEALASRNNISVGKVCLFEGDSVFVHKKNVSRATLCGEKGFLGTIIIEDKYEVKIIDDYFAYDMTQGNGVFYEFRVITYGDKNEITFESLEGRRHYLKTFTHKMAAGRGIFTDFKF